MAGSGDSIDVESQMDSQNAQVDISPDKNGGILKTILREGEGGELPGKGETVYVHYVGTLPDGSKFDSSRDRGQKFEFELGKGSVIKGWDLGVATMKKGELSKFTIASEFAYGKNGSPPKIPPDQTLIFEIELFSWKGEDLSPDKDGGIQRKKITEGSGYQKPNDEATVKVKLVGTYKGSVFEDRETEFIVGEADAAGVVRGIDIAIKMFKKEEESDLKLSPQYAFGDEGKPEFNIPSDAEVTYTVTLLDFEKAKESWEMDVAEKIAQSEIIKTKGTNFFKAGDYNKAVKQYQKIVDYLEQEESLEGEEKQKRDTLVLAGHLNLAMCYLKLNEDTKALNECDAALKMEAKNEKGLFRRGQAHLKLQDFDLAIADFQAVLDIDHNNKAAKNQLSIANQKLKQVKDKQKKIFGGMFDKFAKIDAEKAKHNQDEDKDESTENLEESKEQDIENSVKESEKPMETAN